MQKEEGLILEPKTAYTIHATDCDILGHLNNAKYIEYFHNAREDHLKDVYKYNMDDLIKYESGFVVGNQQIFYFRSAICYEKVVIQSSLIRIEGPKIMVEFIMFNEQLSEIKAIMWTEYIAINKSTGKTDLIPEARMAFFKNTLKSISNIEEGILKRYKELKRSFEENEKK